MPGTLAKLTEQGNVWTFAPTGQLKSNAPMTVKIDATFTSSFKTGTGAGTTPPSFAGIAMLKVVEGTVDLHTDSEPAPDFSIPGGSGGCGSGGGGLLPSGEQSAADGSEYDIFNLEFAAATDNAAPPEAIIYRLFTYSTAGANPGDPAAVVVGSSAAKTTVCGKADESASTDPGPFPTFEFVVGETACVKVEVEDPAGNIAGQQGGTCGVVEPWTVSGFCELLEAFSGDAGVEPARDSSAAADRNADEAIESSDLGSSGIPAGDDTSHESADGSCNCEVGASGSRWLVLLLLLALGRHLRIRRI